MQWKLISEFALQDEDSDKEILKIETSEVNDDDEDDFMNDVLLGLQAIREQRTKVILEANKMKWSSLS